MRRQALVILVLLLAFGLRMVHLQSRPLWYDEAIAVFHASVSPSELVRGTVTTVGGRGAANIHPLLYFLLLHGWIGLVGSSPLAVRFLSLVSGMLTVAVLWRLAAWCFGSRTGLAVGLLAAVSPFQVAYSQETRMYALLALAAVTTVWGLLRALEEGGFRWWALYVTAAALTLYVHNLGTFFLLAANLLAVARRQWWRRLPALALANLTVLALFAPWLVGVLPKQVGFVRQGYWLTPPGAAELIRAAMLPILTFYEPPPTWLLRPALFVGLLLLTLLLLRTWRTHSRAGWFLLLSWTPILLLLLVSLWRPVYLERALLPSALFYAVAIGWLLIRGGLPRPVRLGLAALLIATTGGSLAAHYAYIGFPRPPFQEAVTYLEARIEPTDAVVHTNKLTYLPMHYYAPDLPGDFLADPAGSPQDTLTRPTQEALGIFATPTITEAVGGAERVWVVYFTREVEEVQAAGAEHAVLAWLGNRFVQAEQVGFADLAIALYRREGR